MIRLIDYFLEMVAILNYQVVAYLNETFNIYDDKKLHFIVIGIFGILMFLVLKPLFNYLSKKDLVISITFIYVITLLIVISFAIEIGQYITGSGAMDLKDIGAGLFGFLCIFLFYVSVYYTYKYFKDNKNASK